jgi:hemerythrin-like domain-containing protein
VTSIMSESEFLNVELFINAIENRPALWDSRLADYASRQMTQECWNEVCREMREDFEALSKEKQNEIGISRLLYLNRLRG